ncbi:MAG: hypothetical protein ACRD0O_02450 [Acidimicrobiia bacterium]
MTRPASLLLRGHPGPRAVVLNVVGFVLLVAGWVAVSGKASLSDQAPLLNVSLAGMLLAGIGNALYISGGRRRLDARVSRVRRRFESEAF